MDHNPVLLRWTDTLSGLDAERVTSAREEVGRWGFAHVSAALLADSVDAYVAVSLLMDAIVKLEEAGVERVRLLKKLRQAPDVWSTWAEFRIADSLLRSHLAGSELRLEEGKSAGAHADFRFLLRDDERPLSVEVKAVGMSDEEVGFCERMAPSLEAMLPVEGLGHLHAPIGGKQPKLPRDVRRHLAREAKRRVKNVPMWPRGLRGSTIVAHGSEPSYAVRVGRRVAQAVRQLPESDRCWAAIYWSNGAPFDLVRRNIPWHEIPNHVEGVLLVGCGIAFPHSQIHCFATPIHRDVGDDYEVGVASTEPDQDDLAGIILERFERSSGIRPTLLKVGDQTLVKRDGSARIWPYNLLMDADRAEFGRHATGAPWMR